MGPFSCCILCPFVLAAAPSGQAEFVCRNPATDESVALATKLARFESAIAHSFDAIRARCPSCSAALIPRIGASSRCNNWCVDDLVEAGTNAVDDGGS